MPKIVFKKLDAEAVIPNYAHLTDAGFDLYSIEDKTLKPGERHLFKIGLATEFPSGFFVLIKPKSGLAVKGGIDVLAGVIDSGYRGEWGIVLTNFGDQSYEFKKGDKIAQGILLSVNQAEITEAKDLAETKRGEGGFGSTGK